MVEGRRAVADALATGARPTLVLLREGTEAAFADVVGLADFPRRIVAPRLFDATSDTVTPAGLLAVFPLPTVTPRRSSTSPPLHLVVDRLADPGNLGTLLRAATAAGVTAVHLSPGTVDPFASKVVRAGMGAQFRLTIDALTPESARTLIDECSLRVVARATAGTAYTSLDWRQSALLIVGSETNGVAPDVAALGTVAATIPMAAGVDSLNAAVAAAVILFEAARQRRHADEPPATDC